jgi:hypothetical protein
MSSFQVKTSAWTVLSALVGLASCGKENHSEADAQAVIKKDYFPVQLVTQHGAAALRDTYKVSSCRMGRAALRAELERNFIESVGEFCEKQNRESKASGQSACSGKTCMASSHWKARSESVQVQVKAEHTLETGDFQVSINVKWSFGQGTGTTGISRECVDPSYVPIVGDFRSNLITNPQLNVDEGNPSCQTRQ